MLSMRQNCANGLDFRAFDSLLHLSRDGHDFPHPSMYQAAHVVIISVKIAYPAWIDSRLPPRVPQ